MQDKLYFQKKKNDGHHYCCHFCRISSAPDVFQVHEISQKKSFWYSPSIYSKLYHHNLVIHFYHYTEYGTLT